MVVTEVAIGEENSRGAHLIHKRIARLTQKVDEAQQFSASQPSSNTQTKWSKQVGKKYGNYLNPE
jgi:hypothetical protein